jgi:hypothetical protein
VPTYLTLRDLGKLREAIKASPHSGAAIARAAGVSRQFFNRLAKGERTRINDVAAQVVEKTLGVPKGSLFYLESGVDDASPYLAGPDVGTAA